MRHGGDKVGPAALEPGPLAGVVQGDHQPQHGAAAVRLADVANDDEHLGAVRQVQRALRMPGAGLQAVVRIGEVPPVAAVGVVQRQHAEQVLAECFGGIGAGQLRGGPVEHGDAACVVGDDETVGEFVGDDEAQPGTPQASASASGPDSPALSGSPGQLRAARLVMIYPLSNDASIRHVRPPRLSRRSISVTNMRDGM